MTEKTYDLTADDGAGNTDASLTIDPDKEGFTMAANAVATTRDDAQEALLPADPYVSMIERVALDPNADLEKLERMLAMKERMEDRAREDSAREAQREFFAALANAQAAIPIVVRNKSNSQTNSKYADLAAIEDAAMPVIREKGFAVSAWPVPGAPDGYQRVCFRVTHSGGHCDEVQDDFPLDLTGIKGTVNKTKLHAKQSTVNYARRILTTTYFNIATSDDDGNAGGGRIPSTISAEQFVAVRDKAQMAGVDLEKICMAHGIDTIEQLSANDFSAVMKRLGKNIAANGATNE